MGGLMSSRARNRLFSIALVAVLVAGVVEVLMLIRFVREYVESERSAAAVLERHREMARADPSPTPENLRAAEQNLETLRKRREETWGMLGEGFSIEEQEGGLGTDSQNTYFSIVAYVEAFRELASELDIRIREDEGFGFRNIVEVGEAPPPEGLPQVRLQMSVLRFLLKSLMASRPKEIGAVLREPVPLELEDDGIGWEIGPESEFLLGEGGASGEKPGTVHTLSFYLRFSGHTGTLRRFLNEIGRSKRRVVVRSVVVKPVDQESAQESAVPKLPTPFRVPDVEEMAVDLSAISIVRENLSEFVVSLDYVDSVRLLVGDERMAGEGVR